MKEIISDKNKIFRHALELKKKKYREKWREYLIEGPNLIEEALKEGIELKKIVIDMMVKNTGKDRKTIERDMDRDNWMSDKEAKEYGIIDEIIGA